VPRGLTEACFSGEAEVSWNHYHTPSTIDEAVALLNQYGGQARVIAGGTDLLVDALAESHPPHEALVDITRIPALCVIEDHGEAITSGAGVTHTQIVQSPLMARYATCLVVSCGVIGGPQVRYVATLGGNVARPAAADSTTAGRPRRRRRDHHTASAVPLLDLFRGPGESLLDSTRDLLLRFRFRKSAEREATAFKRIMRPQGVALPILGCADHSCG
jgi:carbon-monoxide dehydrogenase medium subunit